MGIKDPGQDILCLGELGVDLEVAVAGNHDSCCPLTHSTNHRAQSILNSIQLTRSASPSMAAMHRFGTSRVLN